jgi:hypothetical protein
LARARGLSPVEVALPSHLAALPAAAFVEMRLVYDRLARRYGWHLVVDDEVQPPVAAGKQTLAADLGEIHPAAVSNEQGEVVIFSARDLRALNQYRRKRLASLQALIARKQKRSRRWKRLIRRKTFLLARNKRQRRDIEHKVTRAIANHAKREGARRVVVGDVRGSPAGRGGVGGPMEAPLVSVGRGGAGPAGEGGDGEGGLCERPLCLDEGGAEAHRAAVGVLPDDEHGDLDVADAVDERVDQALGEELVEGGEVSGARAGGRPSSRSRG